MEERRHQRVWKDNVPIIKIIDFSQASVIGCPVPDPIPPEKRYVKYKSIFRLKWVKISIFLIYIWIR